MALPYWPVNPTPPIDAGYDPIALLLTFLMLLVILVGVSLLVGLVIFLVDRRRGVTGGRRHSNVADR